MFELFEILPIDIIYFFIVEICHPNEGVRICLTSKKYVHILVEIFVKRFDDLDLNFAIWGVEKYIPPDNSLESICMIDKIFVNSTSKLEKISATKKRHKLKHFNVLPNLMKSRRQNILAIDSHGLTKKSLYYKITRRTINAGNINILEKLDSNIISIFYQYDRPKTPEMIAYLVDKCNKKYGHEGSREIINDGILNSSRHKWTDVSKTWVNQGVKDDDLSWMFQCLLQNEYWNMSAVYTIINLIRRENNILYMIDSIIECISNDDTSYETDYIVIYKLGMLLYSLRKNNRDEIINRVELKIMNETDKERYHDILYIEDCIRRGKSDKKKRESFDWVISVT